MHFLSSPVLTCPFCNLFMIVRQQLLHLFRAHLLSALWQTYVPSANALVAAPKFNFSELEKSKQLKQLLTFVHESRTRATVIPTCRLARRHFCCMRMGRMCWWYKSTAARLGRSVCQCEPLPQLRVQVLIAATLVLKVLHPVYKPRALSAAVVVVLLLVLLLTLLIQASRCPQHNLQARICSS